MRASRPGTAIRDKPISTTHAPSDKNALSVAGNSVAAGSPTVRFQPTATEIDRGSQAQYYMNRLGLDSLPDYNRQDLYSRKLRARIRTKQLNRPVTDYSVFTGGHRRIARGKEGDPVETMVGGCHLVGPRWPWARDRVPTEIRQGKALVELSGTDLLPENELSKRDKSEYMAGVGGPQDPSGRWKNTLGVPKPPEWEYEGWNSNAWHTEELIRNTLKKVWDADEKAKAAE
mmetsp:Transcript_1162/g.2547  ORF Transcript_1162/g.2547 Transcript_1162/m.2547 type:complete len:230 (+) Transcript_1162:1047-1736(+)